MWPLCGSPSEEDAPCNDGVTSPSPIFEIKPSIFSEMVLNVALVWFHSCSIKAITCDGETSGISESIPLKFTVAWFAASLLLKSYNFCMEFWILPLVLSISCRIRPSQSSQGTSAVCCITRPWFIHRGQLLQTTLQMWLEIGSLPNRTILTWTFAIMCACVMTKVALIRDVPRI